jgi:hypothetical protein
MRHDLVEFERADLRNDVAYFERIYTDQTKLALCKAHANSTIFGWANWETFLRCKELESDETWNFLLVTKARTALANKRDSAMHNTKSN